MRRVLLSILVLCSLVVTAEDVTFMNNRRQWEKLPSETLMRMGKQFELKSQPDSMLVCWTIVANRFDEHKQTSSEQAMSIRAILNSGIMYVNTIMTYSRPTQISCVPRIWPKNRDMMTSYQQYIFHWAICILRTISSAKLITKMIVCNYIGNHFIWPGSKNNGKCFNASSFQWLTLRMQETNRLI